MKLHANHFVSFDVYDTVLTRRVGSPLGLFLLLGLLATQQGLVKIGPEAFARIRAVSENQARANASKDEIGIEDIYQELAWNLGLDNQTTQKLMELELELEQRLSVAVPPLKKRLEEMRQNGMRIIFISDMYLSSSFISQLLRQHGLMRDGDLCFVSSDLGVRKSDSRLFRSVCETIGIPRTELEHYGNDRTADYIGARRAGLRSYLLEQGNLNRYERIWEDWKWYSQGATSVIAGISRITRLSIEAKDEREVCLRDVSASVAAPVLTAYVLWVLLEASRLGLRKLYFLSRDGYILLDIAKLLAPHLDIEIPMQYLYGSRRAWLLPGLASLPAEQLSEILCLHYHRRLSPRRFLMEWVRLDPEVISDIFITAGFTPDKWDRPLTSSEIKRLGEVLSLPKISSRIREKAILERNLLLKYLEQEGIGNDPMWGIVDLGWTGNMLTSLARVLQQAGYHMGIPFYFGVFPKINLYEFAKPQIYMYDGYRNTGVQCQVPYLTTLLEMFCTSDTNPIIGYTEGANGVYPVFREDHNALRIREWGYQLVRETILKFTQEISESIDLIDLKADLRPAIAQVLAAFWTTPTRNEVKAWGSFPFEDYGIIKPIAIPYPLGSILATLQQGRIPPPPSYWKAGCLEITPPIVKFFMKLCYRFQRPARWLVRRSLTIIREGIFQQHRQ